ncbi:hypothetical protein [Chitinophaga pinensis]|uniref:Uncharacterized protein n=1 Tax=Chitinophaga pinensis (strain ATCC 43595 / DSM 2588 / LMG 13176 / NBRC 15968 / NCIMB 11800 / UQM 2034) TaxID=485918 RepID=A0A979G4G9_CHIPD|nr:hypothetical protein [Chitinophaga pinensis]ACU60639.1 hypothetical protein Cpin_3172 [Chitinophaga pinensis DSM 2588]
MYLHYDVAPHFLNGQRFPIDRPVANEKEADAFVQHARRQVENGSQKSYFGFKLLDINKKEILKQYSSITRRVAISSAPENKSRRR